MLVLTSDPAAPVRQIQRRPKDRRARIARAAAEEFSAHGYHAASMNAIAAKVGISGPALYRHYPSKYDLFAAAVPSLSQHLVDSTDFLDAVPDSELAADPGAVFGRLVDALIDATLANRESGELCRWQVHNLHDGGLAALLKQLRVVSGRLQRAMSMGQPLLSSPQRWMLSSGLLSVIGSIVDHRTRLSTDQMHALLGGAASVMITAQLPEPGDDVGPVPPARRILNADAGAHEDLLDMAMVLFGRQGYPETTMTQLADHTGVPVSGIYRYFPGKYAILATGLRRAAERVFVELSTIAGAPGEPRRVLTQVIETYVAISFANPELTLVYHAERLNLAGADQLFLRKLLRSVIDLWTTPLISIRPELSVHQARVLVHAAMALVVDLGWLAGQGRLVSHPRPANNSAYLQTCVRKLIDCTLFGSALDQRM